MTTVAMATTTGELVAGLAPVPAVPGPTPVIVSLDQIRQLRSPTSETATNEAHPPAELAELAEMVSARAFGIVSVTTGEMVAGSAVEEVLHIASITKVLTFLTVFEAMKGDSSGVATLLKRAVRVSSAAAAVKQGTHASLRAGDTLTVLELLYAMMLPSGNDAATALAETFGKRMLASESRAVLSADGAGVAVARFVKAMATFAKRQGLTSFRVHDPHGMRGSRNNKANVRDLASLTQLAMRNPVFVEIYGTKRVKNLAVVRSISWRNTNDMLWGSSDGIECVGGKTGWIPNVGDQKVWGSLTAVVSRNVEGASKPADRYIIVVLGCSSRKRRFIDSRAIARWVYGLVSTEEPPDATAIDEP